MPHSHILIVEADDDDAFLFCRAVKDLPFCTAFRCRSLGEAKAYFARTGEFQDGDYPKANVVVTELRLGAESGHDLLSWMRGREDIRNVPVYVLAGVVSPQDREILKSVGTKRVIEKPSSNKELKEVVREIAEEVCGS